MSSQFLNKMKRNLTNVGQCQLDILAHVFSARGYVLDDRLADWVIEQMRVGVPIKRLINTVENGKRAYPYLKKTDPAPFTPVTAVFKKLRGRLKYRCVSEVESIRTVTLRVTPEKSKYPSGPHNQVGSDLWHVAIHAEHAVRHPARLGVFNEYRKLVCLASTMPNGISREVISTLTHYCGLEVVSKIASLDKCDGPWHVKAHYQAQLTALGEVYSLLLKANQAITA